MAASLAALGTTGANMYSCHEDCAVAENTGVAMTVSKLMIVRNLFMWLLLVKHTIDFTFPPRLLIMKADS